MKLRGRKFFKIGRKFRLLIAGGLSKRGEPYAYTGIKHKKSGISLGASVGSRGKEVYVSKTKKKWQTGLKYNLNSSKITPKIKIKKKKVKRNRVK